jgi:hypothetical protein
VENLRIKLSLLPKPFQKTFFLPDGKEKEAPFICEIIPIKRGIVAETEDMLREAAESSFKSKTIEDIE